MAERRIRVRWREEIHRHVAAAAEGRLELLEHQKHFTIVRARIVRRLDVHGPDLPAVLTGAQIRAGYEVRVVEAQTRRTWCERDPSMSVRRN